ncbi:metallophosphoesterase [Flavobacteriaceae bacterium PRS1]|nr:metallophosphoesterase [Flavobacteriaceae bacterium PRS1]
MFRWIIFIAIFSAIDFYAFQALKTLIKSNWIHYLYFLISALVLGNFIYQLIHMNGLSINVNIAIGLFLTLYLPKIAMMLFMFGEDIIRLPIAAYSFFTENDGSQTNYFPTRRKFISQVALGIAAIPFVSLLYGMYIGKYNFKVLKYTLYFEDLPDAFNGYKITQISDIHSGSFDNKEKIEYAVDLVSEQQSDVIFFTGDLVNNKAEEMIPWMDTFSRLKAKDGIFSILGNHDYGDYVRWESEEAKKQNLIDLAKVHRDIGFDLLMNESRFLEKDGQRIAIVGIENWGKGFKQKGDLVKAAHNIDANDFKILMSHDPTHWEQQVIEDDYHYHLTLSGHTHGMQFGIEIPGWIKWSPVKWRYKYWAGIYKEKGQYINVNRGFGFLAYPGRVGIWPEITVIELKKGSNPV